MRIVRGVTVPCLRHTCRVPLIEIWMDRGNWSLEYVIEMIYVYWDPLYDMANAIRCRHVERLLCVCVDYYLWWWCC